MAGLALAGERAEGEPGLPAREVGEVATVTGDGLVCAPERKVRVPVVIEARGRDERVDAVARVATPSVFPGCELVAVRSLVAVRTGARRGQAQDGL